jgi:DNA repair exonuclease SbcCD nuclease subunit
LVHTLIRHDIEVVIIDGNHETSNWLHTGSPTSVLQELGAHVVNDSVYEIIRDEDWSSHSLKNKEKLAIHALPYRAVHDQAFTGVAPLSGYVNILLTHGRVHGMDELNSLRHASAGIPKDVLRRGWHYVALGDWHIHSYQPLLDVPAYYAGSLEALNFGEAAAHPPRQGDPNAIHGALDVRLSLDEAATVHTLANTNPRPVLRLEAIDATSADPESLMEELRKRFESELPQEAVVCLDVKNCPSKTWDQLDHAEIEQLRRVVRRCEIRWDIQQPSTEQSREALSEASLDDQWQHYLDRTIQDEAERAWYSQQGLQLIDAARKELLSVRASAGDEGE